MADAADHRAAQPKVARLVHLSELDFRSLIAGHGVNKSLTPDVQLEVRLDSGVTWDRIYFHVERAYREWLSQEGRL